LGQNEKQLFAIHHRLSAAPYVEPGGRLGTQAEGTPYGAALNF